jgi:hypothetical protein
VPEIPAVALPPVASTRSLEKETSSSEPTIYAEFELKNGKPLIVDESYKIWVETRNVPDGTRKVHYEILDDSFSEPKFSVDWTKDNFADWITSYGDIFLTAEGKGKNGPWRTQTTLAKALKLNYGPTPKTVIRNAIADIEEN